MTKLPVTLLAVACSMFLSACGKEPPPARIRVPPKYLTCAAEPVPPSPAGEGGKFTDAQASSYLIDVIEAGADCRNKVAAVRAWNAQD